MSKPFPNPVAPFVFLKPLNPRSPVRRFSAPPKSSGSSYRRSSDRLKHGLESSLDSQGGWTLSKCVCSVYFLHTASASRPTSSGLRLHVHGLWEGIHGHRAGGDEIVGLLLAGQREEVTGQRGVFRFVGPWSLGEMGREQTSWGLELPWELSFQHLPGARVSGGVEL